MTYFNADLIITALLYLYPLVLLGASYRGYIKKKKNDSFYNSAFFVLILLLLPMFLPWKGRWPLPFKYPYFISAIILFITIILIKSFDLNSLKEESKKKRFSSIGFLSLFLIPLYIGLTSTPGPVDKTVDLTFPMKNGTFVVSNGGDNSFINHHYHYGAQKYALDIIKICPKNIFTKYKTQNEDFCIWGNPLYAACAGTISHVGKGIFDNKPFIQTNKKDIKGNHIYLACDNGTSVMYAHIKDGSLKVNVGDRVHLDSVIGYVGNSGNSSEPHLHIQAATQTGEPAVMRFNGRALMTNDDFTN